MIDRFGEYTSIYVWPSEHVDGEDFPEDFLKKLDAALESVGINWECA